MKKIASFFLIIFSQLCFANIEDKVSSIKKDLKLGLDEKIGIAITDNSNSVTSYNGGISFIPASTFKIVSAYYILENLSPKYRFETKFGYRGRIKNGTLQGDLILNLSGDPYLLTSDLYNMALSLREKGIKTITGNLIISTDFPSIKRIGHVGLDDQPYNQGISALNVNFNRFKAIRNKEKAIAFPQLDYLKVTHVDKLSPGEIFRRDNKAGTESWKSSKLEKYFYEVPIRDPLNFNANYLIKLIKELGIRTSGKVKLEKEIMTKTLYSKSSLPTLKLVELALEYSNNLFIEILTLKASKAKTLNEAALNLRAFYKKRFPNLGIHNLDFKNNSGLSLELKIKPETIAKLLQKVAMKKYEDKYFVSLLSLAGNGGFLSKRFLSAKTHLKFFAKTGSLDYVNGICGHTLGNQRSFCVFINNAKLRSRLQGSNDIHKDKLRRSAKLWKRKTDAALDKIITFIVANNFKAL